MGSLGKSGSAIIYLGVIGSLIGFALYYYVLRHLDAIRVALITMITPVSALLLGHYFNDEALTVEVWIGTAFIVTGLALFESIGRPTLKKAQGAAAG